MFDILAQITNEIPTGIVAGTTSAGIVMLFIKHVTNSTRHMNGKKYQSFEVCNERHKSIDEKLIIIDKKLDKLLEK